MGDSHRSSSKSRWLWFLDRSKHQPRGERPERPRGARADPAIEEERSEPARLRPKRAGARPSDLLAQRQVEEDVRSDSELALQADRALVLLDDVLDHAEAQARAALLALGREERLEDLL